jgi:hypothetical protein
VRHLSRSIAVAVAPLLVGFSPPLAAQSEEWSRAVQAKRDPPPAAVTIRRVAQAPKLEAFVSSAAPESLAAVTAFRQREPGDGVPVSAPTAAYLSYDATHLYVVFVCKDDPAQIRAGLSKREEIDQDDGVAVYLDTFHDLKHAYVFQVNPRGVQLDGIVTEGQDDDYSFDTVWQSESRLTQDGYVVRIAIPFRSLRFPRTPTQSWGVALARFIRRTNEDAYWPHVTKRVAAFVGQFATLDGLHDISPSRNLQANPYSAFTGARFLDTDSAAFESGRDRRVGVDVKGVIRDALTLDATVNPDFSQVESDEPQVTINERFETFYPEKRPFFIENAGFFQTPVILFHSRRITDPGGGVRLSGKAGRWAVGALGINDRATGLPGDPNAGVGVLRLQREIADESTIGVLISDREVGPSGTSNQVLSADARAKLSKTWIATGQAIATRVQEAAWSNSSAGVYAKLERDGRNLDYSASYLELGSGFDADLGFVKRVGIRELKQKLNAVVRPEGPVVKIGPTFSTDQVWDRSGTLLDRSLEGVWEFKFLGETKIELGHALVFERFDDVPFQTRSSEVALESEWLKWLAASASYSWGTAVNHKPPAGVAPSRGDAGEAEVTFTFRPTSRLRLDHTWLYSRLTTPGGARIFTDRIWREKLNYQFSRALSLRAIVDYSAIDRDSTRSRLDRERAWSVDGLLTYLVNPGTALYLGYRDGYENLAILPGSPATLYRTDSPSTSVGRQFFVKVSYLWRF